MFAASKIVEAILHCRAVHTLDLILLIVKCPMNKIKIFKWMTLALEKSFRLINSNTHLNSHEIVAFSRVFTMWEVGTVPYLPTLKKNYKKYKNERADKTVTMFEGIVQRNLRWVKLLIRKLF